ncbi:hypothetical protein KEM54_000494 [Ascosphaera aggregata]|nr:hypothetical protein KEM54_000494 [Ascosphaera aggregata]
MLKVARTFVLQAFLLGAFARGKEVPDFVKIYAPVVYLQSDDPYMPADYGEFLDHVWPVNQANHTVPDAPSPLTLDNLDQLNDEGGSNIYLTSKEGIQANPEWFKGQDPSSSEASSNAAIITTDMGNGTLDAFYFYWYNYNQGNTVIGMEFGDHVGDWEHNLIRFENEVPTAIYYSQHADGLAYAWNIVEKEGDRPITYSAKGSHANYATQGKQDRHEVNSAIPPGFLIDTTDRGKRWDTITNARYYEFDRVHQSLSAYVESDPVNWLLFNGLWGDATLPKEAKGQISLFGQNKYSAGPQGPIFKKLDREQMCINGCSVQSTALKQPNESAIDAAIKKTQTEFDEKGDQILENVLKWL